MTLRASRTSMAEFRVTNDSIQWSRGFSTPPSPHVSARTKVASENPVTDPPARHSFEPRSIRRSGRSCWSVLQSARRGSTFIPTATRSFTGIFRRNPVDLEQREGRVHRYKNHAVRRNVGQQFRAAATQSAGDPWAHAFTLAVRERDPADGDLVPFWVYPLAGGAQIERHVLALPLSRELDRLEALRLSWLSTGSASGRHARTTSSRILSSGWALTARANSRRSCASTCVRRSNETSARFQLRRRSQHAGGGVPTPGTRRPRWRGKP